VRTSLTEGAGTWRSTRTGPPAVLYHYTTAKGLIGIVQSQTLWATNADFLNDAQELQFGRRELHDALHKQADALSPPDDESGGPNYARATVMRSAADQLFPGGLYAQRRYHAVYVACFCEKPDLLSQWQRYGGPGGYAVGLRAFEIGLERPAEPGPRSEQFGPIEEASAEGPRLVKVRYGNTAMGNAIAKVLHTIAPRPVGHPGADGYARAQSIVLPALAGIKHPAFYEEREWRLVVVTDQHKPCFRPSPLGVTPYISLRYPRDAITEVIVGPGAEQDLREQGVKLLVGEEVDVRSSGAPFRG
jgi:hypothetical protein